ncbi:cell surface protein [Bacilli bacterium]|nr:cell surface protein [Bacilli bacterium]
MTEDTGAGGTVVLPTDPKDPTTELPDTIFPGGQKPDITDPNIDITKPITTNPEYPNEILPGYAGELFFNLIPKQFDFGSHKVSAADQQSGVTYKQEAAAAFSGVQAVGVHDGRVSSGDDWHVEAELGSLANLKGASITFANTQVKTQYTGTPALGKGHVGTSFTLTEGAGAKSFLSAGTQSKGNTAAYWDNLTDLELSVPAGSLKTGAHTADVTWTLTNTPEV